MKYNNLITICCLSTSLLLNSCDLEVIPPSSIAAESFWKTDKDAWYALNACYATLEGADILDELCTDNAHSHKPWEGNFEMVQQDGISTANGYGSYYFGTIRLTNNFLKNIETCNITDQLKTRMKAEARFFRAMSYLDLTTKFGKVPIIETVLDYNAPNLKRDDIEQVHAFILQELDDISNILPDKYTGGFLNEPGRITRAGALALRARAALYFGNYEQAELSSAAIISEGHHALFKIETLNESQQKEALEMDAYIDYDSKNIDREKFIKGLFSYECLWHDSYANTSNPEYIVTRQYMADDKNNDWMRYTYFIPKSLSAYDGYCSYEPMQDLINSYWDINGKSIRDNITVDERKKRFQEIWDDFKTYQNDQKGFFNKVTSTNIMSYKYMEEFRNRDSRLYASVLFPFKGWHETVKGTFYFMFNPNNINKDGNESWTGYAYRKMVDLTPYNNWACDCDYPTIRYAEVLLTFAESHVQNSGWDKKVQDALNELRDRCGMPNVPTTFSSKEEALSFIKNERRIELAGEGQRYDDIRRYGNDYCNKFMNGPSYAPNGYVVINKKWSSRLMLMPIPQDVINVNPILKEDQNSGY